MIKIKKFSKNNFVTWDSFVLKANNGTIFHLRKFLSYHPKDRFKDHSLEISLKVFLRQLMEFLCNQYNPENVFLGMDD